MKIYHGKEPGVKASYSRRDMVEEAAALAGIVPRDYELSHCCWCLDHLRQFIEVLDGDTRVDTRKAAAEELARLCGFDLERYQGEYYCFNKDRMWRILQTVKRAQGEAQK